MIIPVGSNQSPKDRKTREEKMSKTNMFGLKSKQGTREEAFKEQPHMSLGEAYKLESQKSLGGGTEHGGGADYIDAGRVKQAYQKTVYFRALTFVTVAINTFVLALQNRKEFERVQEDEQFIMLWFATGFSLGACLLNAVRMYYLHLLGDLRQERRSSFCSWRWLMFFLLHSVAILTHPHAWTQGVEIPIYNDIINETVVYKLNDFLQVAAVLRLTFYGYYLFLFSRFGDDSTNRICGMYDVELTPIFVMRAYLKFWPFRFIMALLVMLILVFAHMVQIVETPVFASVDTTKTAYTEPDHRDFVNCVWEVFLVIFTVGYGEVYPLTQFGRIVLFVNALLGVTTVSAIVATVMGKLGSSMYEEKSMLVMRRLFIRKTIREQAAGLIVRWYRNVVLHRKGELGVNPKVVFDMNHRCIQLQKTLREYRSMGDVDFSSSMFTYFEFLKNQQKELFLNIGILAKIIKTRELDEWGKMMFSTEGQNVEILLDILDRSDINLIKDQLLHPLRQKTREEESKDGAACEEIGAVDESRKLFAEDEEDEEALEEKKSDKMMFGERK